MNYSRLLAWPVPGKLVKPRRQPLPSVDTLASDYRTMTLHQLADKYGHDHRTIAGILRAANIQIRPRRHLGRVAQ